MDGEAVARSTILQVRDGLRTETDDWVVVEEPLEIRIGGESLALIMRTPGRDLELAAGFAL
ncbi:MAG TPA: sulfurtransferase FdhD, partial [Candidatus Polarisedimenticolia bacterium]